MAEIADAGPEDASDGETGGDAAEAGACAPSTLDWSPSALPGLVVWLNAGTLTASPVTTWTDQSPAGNDATQTLGDTAPTLVASSIGGQPGVHFDGAATGMQIADALSLQFGKGAFSMFVVVSFATSVASQQEIFQKSATAFPWPGPALNANFAGTRAFLQIEDADDELLESQPITRFAPHLLGASRRGQTVALHVDGHLRALASLSPIDVSAPGQAFTLGRGYAAGASQALLGDIDEIIVVKGKMEEGDFRTAECHLLLKYGL